MLLTELVTAPAYLYHGLSPVRAEEALKRNEIRGFTSHRSWEDGARRWDKTEPGWENHTWMKGVSLTRDRRFAEQWGAIVFVLDADKLRQHYKIDPLAWSPRNPKREKEEWVRLHKSDHISGDGPHIMQYLNDPIGSIKPLDRYLVSVYISPEQYKYDDMLRWMVDDFDIVNHPKFIKTF